jgi:hypothetical protein
VGASGMHGPDCLELTYLLRKSARSLGTESVFKAQYMSLRILG